MNTVHSRRSQGRVARVGASGALGLVVALLPAIPAGAAGPSAVTIQGGPTSASDPTPVELSADIYVPDVTPAPAVILALGFGGSKESVVDQATDLVNAGFVVAA